jgi:uncharacterized protein (DUF952 family)
MSAEIIYHITTEAEWHAAQGSGYFAAMSLAIEGFIHCATGHQVQGVLNRYFRQQKDLLLLALDVSKLVHPPVYEMAASINEAFLHIYGPINTDAVVSTRHLNND